MDGRAWQAIIHWVAKSQTRLSGFTSLHFMYVYIGLSCSSAGKESTCNAGGSSLIPGLERGRLPTPVFFDFPIDLSGRESTALWETWFQSLGWEDTMGEGMAIHCSYLGIPVERGAWWATVHGISKSWTQPTKHIFVCIHTQRHTHTQFEYSTIHEVWSLIFL